MVFELYRASMIGCAMILLGMAALVVKQYAPRAIEGKGAIPLHVTGIASSYCLLLIMAMGTHAELLFSREGFTWRLGVAPFAYVLGFFSLRMMLIDINRRRSAGLLRRETDPIVK